MINLGGALESKQPKRGKLDQRMFLSKTDVSHSWLNPIYGTFAIFLVFA